MKMNKAKANQRKQLKTGWVRKVEKSTDITEVSFRIILHAGNGKGSAMEAIQAAKAGSFEQADELIEEAGRELAKAHEFQTNLIQQEANGGRTELNVLLIHSQDHLMTSMTVRDLAIEIIEIYRTKKGTSIKMAHAYSFPKDFWWGSAVSATQIEGAANEGGKGKNIWDHWYELEPNRFFEEVGPSATSDFYHRYQDDIALMKAIGHNSFRFSISWSRLIPGGEGEVNKEAVAFYNNVIDELIANGIEPFVNLFHFDMPFELQEKGGWENREVVELYAQYAATCYDLFGDRVKKWFTFNEPIVPVEGGYLYDFHYPNIVDARRAFQVAYHTVLAHALAVAALPYTLYRRWKDWHHP